MDQRRQDDKNKKQLSARRPGSIEDDLLPDEPKRKAAPSKAPYVPLGASDLNPPFNPPSISGTGGMHMGPDHPIFHQNDRSNRPIPLHTPSEARYDPISPFPGSAEPDNDELMPPRQGSWVMGPDGKPRVVKKRNDGNDGDDPNIVPRINRPGDGDGGPFPPGMGSGRAPFFH